MDIDGNVVTKLDQNTTLKGLQNAYDAGIRCVAIAFIHGYKYPQHEQCVHELATRVGFTQISTTHTTSPLIKLVSRGSTTVVDAYLSPILRRYVQQVEDALKESKNGRTESSCDALMFMQSHGGLTDAHLFQGKGAILSGPAGGVLGMA